MKVNSSFDIDANQTILGSSEFKNIDVSYESKDKSWYTFKIGLGIAWNEIENGLAMAIITR